MLYEYKCECNYITEISMKMTDEHPKSVKCEKCGKDAYRHFVLTPIVPEHMKAGNESPFNYEKNPSIHGKKYF
jgi:hypothetical protein